MTAIGVGYWIASKLTLTPEHFSRVPHELAPSGLLEIDERRITVPSRERLQGAIHRR